MKLSYYKIIFVLALICGLFLPSVVSAYSNFGDLNYRINYNKNMYFTANNQGKLTIDRYRDKSLKDMYETNYTSLSSSNQMLISQLADDVISNSGASTNIEKLKAFHDFIRDTLEVSNNPSNILGTSYNNPATIVKYYNNHIMDENLTIPAKSNGYASLFIALARSENIPARVINGYYESSARNNEINWGSNVSTNSSNYIWPEAYVDGRWVIVDALADDYDNEEDINLYGDKYFDISYQDLSKTHIIFSYRNGSTDRRYIDNSYETGKLKSFLNKTYDKKTNGKRINSSYNVSNPATWFSSSDNISIGDGSGRLVKLNFPYNRNLRGTLDISGFSKLTYLKGSSNKISKLKIVNNPLLKTIYMDSNQITIANVTGNKNLTTMSLLNNPITYAKYNFKNNNSTAVFKSNTGGTISVFHQKNSKGYYHEARVKTKSGYTFKGWYNSKGKKVSSKKKFAFYKSGSFTYTAKYVPKTYVVVSIKNQKMWYYKYGKLKLSTKVVTGTKGQHDTPKGTYYISGKAKNIYLIGADYRSWVDYWMLISPKYQIGFHDATWRSSFGGNIYKTNGSHGCVNMPYSKAKKLYSIMPIGTKVIIK